ncbi:hypothetical protein F2P81_008355 [Scophthalmus maximus]|uniref:Secreted protein n=1 Tax=Scophthalmus maximus TaxID=52904 RepID=A0A6A4T813_SCOMX|nr:hypothetical protein F2P81_008355 [Scophthalmus maximus]
MTRAAAAVIIFLFASGGLGKGKENNITRVRVSSSPLQLWVRRWWCESSFSAEDLMTEKIRVRRYRNVQLRFLDARRGVDFLICRGISDSPSVSLRLQMLHAEKHRFTFQIQIPETRARTRASERREAGESVFKKGFNPTTCFTPTLTCRLHRHDVCSDEETRHRSPGKKRLCAKLLPTADVDGVLLAPVFLGRLRLFTCFILSHRLNDSLRS